MKFSKKEKLLYRDNYSCCNCGTSKDLTADHIVPKSLGGTGTYHNLQVLCRSCNLLKGVKVIIFTRRRGAKKYVLKYLRKCVKGDY